MFPRLPRQGDESNGWSEKLYGKTVIGDDENTDLPEHEVIRPKDLPEPYRFVKPKSMVTMDYNPSRLNIRLDQFNRIVGTSLG
ncbi:hypothetical protein DFQ28_004101 [Apophysomyces sp. BC1034]|nr:hypothetical protein DFQ30_001355 [Apophysomyces sp. BC1015]KAG0182459.1 hypothetical protein DFQ29_004081 [Apophysomyces sp. BC1021]KAG0193660.1 hypothetical protein DFQ28_004101 [Apophysomyces sp. BC1034]